MWIFGRWSVLLWLLFLRLIIHFNILPVLGIASLILASLILASLILTFIDLNWNFRLLFKIRNSLCYWLLLVRFLQLESFFELSEVLLQFAFSYTSSIERFDKLIEGVLIFKIAPLVLHTLKNSFLWILSFFYLIDGPLNSNKETYNIILELPIFAFFCVKANCCCPYVALKSFLVNFSHLFLLKVNLVSYSLQVFILTCLLILKLENAVLEFLDVLTGNFRQFVLQVIELSITLHTCLYVLGVSMPL